MTFSRPYTIAFHSASYHPYFGKHFFFTKCPSLRRNTNMVQGTCVLDNVPGSSNLSNVLNSLLLLQCLLQGFCFPDPYFNKSHVKHPPKKSTSPLLLLWVWVSDHFTGFLCECRNGIFNNIFVLFLKGIILSVVRERQEGR